MFYSLMILFILQLCSSSISFRTENWAKNPSVHLFIKLWKNRKKYNFLNFFFFQILKSLYFYKRENKVQNILKRNVKPISILCCNKILIFFLKKSAVSWKSSLDISRLKKSSLLCNNLLHRSLYWVASIGVNLLRTFCFITAWWWCIDALVSIKRVFMIVFSHRYSRLSSKTLKSVGLMWLVRS